MPSAGYLCLYQALSSVLSIRNAGLMLVVKQTQQQSMTRDPTFAPMTTKSDSMSPNSVFVLNFYQTNSFDGEVLRYTT